MKNQKSIPGTFLTENGKPQKYTSGFFWLKMENPKVYQGPFMAENYTPKVYQRANFETLNILTPLSLHPLSLPLGA